MSLLPFRKDIPVSLGDLQAEMNGLFDRLWHSGLSTKPFDGYAWAPAIDVVEEPDRFIVKAEVPGLDAADIDVSYSDGALTLKGQKAKEYTEEDDCGVVRCERRFGQFARSITVPGEVDPTKISAKCHNGLLQITLPKKEEARSRSIKIDVAE